eukprot:CAMPEP_0167761540 /NCGR_PEP_ID=MMETSP0110_2-20121227/12233_1 /TAXON_ID=629695 /ORGANISM="Gymnochlora sp., Strain CCMP2014" /LENGTH=912 /DNA_ID=CAMNT_0007648243 /DNA_START=155 /DNA_END=2893 /DNA_ORIENTATION=-
MTKKIPVYPVRIASSTYLKNFVKKNWATDPEEKNRIHPDDRQKLKENIIQVMLSTEEKVRNQLGETVQLICKEDFPKKWQRFLPEVVKRLDTPNPETIFTILNVLESVVRRYRFEAASNELWAEIKFVHDNFFKQLLALLKKISGLISGNQNNQGALTSIFKCLDMICQLFYSLSVQDIPAFVQDHKNDFFSIFLNLIKYNNDLIKPRTMDEPGLLENTKGGICDVLVLYTNKYEEDFNQFVQKFVTTVWDMLTKTDEKAKYDLLVPKAIKFLTTVVSKKWHKDKFGNENSIKVFAEKVIIPQLKLRELDLENFQYNGVEYVRGDMEGSDVDTRRRTTVDFVRGLCKFFEKQVTQILKGYIEVLLKRYQSNPKENWMQKDIAMYIVMALAIRGKTRAHGATELNSYINVGEFFKNQVVPELKSNVKDVPVLKADCLKFIIVFRKHLPVQAYLNLIPIIAQYLKHPNYVVHSYSAHCIERLLNVRDKDGKRRMNKSHLKPYLKPLLAGLFSIFDQDDSQENEYGMKAIMRVCSVGEETLGDVTGIILKNITKILSVVAKNPRNPRFNHYLFETVACLVKNVCKATPSAVESFEKELFIPFQQMLGMETCQEFGPYVFQILSQLLELRTKMTGPYEKIFGALLHPAMWDNKGNIPALIRLLVAYLRVDASVVGNKLEGLLGIFQKLVGNKREDHHGMALISAIIEALPVKSWGKYGGTALKMMFMRLNKSKTQKFTCNFVSFAAFLCYKHGPNTFLGLVDQVQKGVAPSLIQKVIIPNIPKVEGKIERKMCAVGMIDLLCKSKPVASSPQMWGALLVSIINLFELPEQNNYEEEDIMDASARGFKTVYARLANAPERMYDPVQKVKNPKAYLAQSLGALTARMPNTYLGVIKKFPEKYQSALLGYLKAAGVTLK